MKLAGILLAAGRSERFGARDKLMADYRGAPLVSHAASALRGVSPDFLIAVTGSHCVAAVLSGFDSVSPSGRDKGLSDSLRAGISYAHQQGATRALVVLGDMPLVTTDLVREVVLSCSSTAGSATTDGTRRMPPACFPERHFPELTSLSGDQGAKHLLSSIPDRNLVTAPPDVLQDVDTHADLERLADRSTCQ